jgi:tRNA nucleotidyltransferase (CCA-adding enzyme)
MEASRLADRVRALPAMDRVLPALGHVAPTYLVGGAVRDLLRGEQTVDLDLAVEGDADVVARLLANRLGGAATVQHERFGTATVTAAGISFDLAATRRERYPEPGALPEVEPAPLAEDLGRRDFTVNAMAVHLHGDALGRVEDPHDGRDDLREGLVRVMHDASFVDDPTRLLRALRYAARLDLRLEEHTDELAREAVEGGAPATVSGPRVGDELLDLLSESAAPAAVEAMARLGLDRALHPRLVADPDLVASAALGCYETGADPALAGLAAMCVRAPAELEPWVASLGLRADRRRAVAWAATRGPVLAGELRAERTPSELHALLKDEPPEALALALAAGAPPEPILRFVHELRPVRLEITGADLLAAGVPESPVLGNALAETLRRKLDGELSGREQELAAALALARGSDRQ